MQKGMQIDFACQYQSPANDYKTSEFRDAT